MIATWLQNIVRERLATATTQALAIAALLLLAPMGVRADVSNVTVSLTNQNVGEGAAYTISLTLGTNLGNNGDYVITFPTGTGGLGSLTNSDVQITNVTAGGDKDTDGLAVSGTQLTIGNPNGLSTNAGNLIQIVVGNTGGNQVTNPSTEGTDYTIDVNTTAETNNVTSSTYTLVLAEMTAAAIILNTSTVNTASTYQFEFTSSKQVDASEYFHIIFPTGTTLGTATASEWTVNSEQPTSVTFTGGALRASIQVASNVLPGGVTIAHSGSNLTNSTTPSSSHTVKVFSSTASDGTGALDDTTTSNAFILTNSAAPTVTGVTVSPTTVSNIASYTIASALASNAGLAIGDTVTYTFPSGTTIPSSMSTGDVTLTHAAAAVSVGSIVTDPTNRTVALVLSAALAASGPDTVVFAVGAAIANPSSSGSSYTVTMRTTLQPTAGTSNTYTIASSSTLTPANVAVSPNTFKTAAQYTVSFSVGDAGALTNGSHYINVKFPVGTTVPASISASYVTVNSVQVSGGVTPSPATRSVTFTTGVDIANNEAVTVVFDAAANIKNPTNTGDYTVSVSTQMESAVTSNSYAIIESQVSTPTITSGSNQPLVATAYTVAFNVGAGGDLTSGSSTITIDFHDSTTVAASVSASDITVNGTTVSLTPSVTTNESKITFTSPVSVSANGAVSVVVQVGMTNARVGSYTGSVHTSIESTPVTSSSYSITTATSVTSASVTSSNTAVSGSSTYTITFTTNSAMEGTDGHSVYIDFPDNFDVSGASGTVADDGDGNETLDATNIDNTPSTIQFLLRNHANTDIAASSVVTVTVNTVTNPATGQGYHIKVYTTTDANPVTLPHLVVTSSTVLASASVTPDPLTANTIASYSIAVTTAADAVMEALVDSFFVQFPATATLPASISASDVVINGSVAGAVGVSGQIVQVQIPAEISASTAVTISISSDAGILNPTATGSQTWTLSSNIQTTTTTANATISAITNVSAANVTPSPSTVNSSAQYTLDFTMGGTGLSSSETITVTFPDNTSVPSSMDAGNVTVNEAGTGQTLTSIATNAATRVVTITMGEAVAAAASMQIVFSTAAGLSNPSTVASTYTLTVAATGNGSTESNVYDVTNSQVSSATVSVSPSIQSGTGAYTIDFSVGSGGALTAGSNTIEITFPSGTTLPAFMAASDVTVNGTILSGAPTISGQAVTLTTPVSVSNGGAVTVVFTAGASITNPAIVSTGYTLQLCTSKETTKVIAQAYSITRGSDVSSVSVTLGTSTFSTTSTYTLDFTTGTSGIASSDSLYVVFPSGTTVPGTFTASTVTLNAVAATAVAAYPSDRIVRVTSGTTVSASTATTLAFTNVGGELMTNPSTTGSNYTLTLRVDSTEAPVTSSKYTVTSSTTLASVTASPSPATTGSAAAYTIGATTASNGALAVGDSIVVVFPAGTTVPASMTAANVSVDGVTATYAPVINQGSRRVAVVTPVAVSASTTFELIFSASAGLNNPATATDYTLTVATNIQPTAGTSSPVYTIATSATVSSATVTPSPATVNTVGEYTINFTLGGVTALVAGDTLTLTFPSGTVVPATIDTSAVTVTDDGSTVDEHATNGTTTDAGNRIVYIRVAAGIAVSSVIEVTLSTAAGIKNPTTAGNSNTITVAATNNNSAASNVYTIDASTVTAGTVTPSPTTENTAAEYTVAFSTGAGGALTTGTHTITVTFPSGTTVPSTMAANKVTVNGTAVSVAPTCNTSNRTVQVTTPVDVSASSAVSVVFTSASGLVNPGDGTNYTAYVQMSPEPTNVQTNTYSITSGSDISSVSVALGNAAIDSVSTYTITLTTGTGGLSTSDTLFVQFPSGTTVPASITNTTVTIDGTASTAVTTTPGSRLAQIESNSTVGASTSCTLIFTDVASQKMTNPSSSGSNYTLTARIGNLSTPITSSVYTITSLPTETLAQATVTPSPAPAGATAAYTIATTTGANGALAVGDSIVTSFPSGTTVPASMTAANITVNGTACTVAPTISGQTVKVVTATAVSASTALSLAFSSSAGLINPTAASYALDTLYSNIAPVGPATASSNYTIDAASTVSSAGVTPSPATISATAQYTLTFTIGSTADLAIGVDIISVVFPSGTTIPASISKSSITVNGVNSDAVTVTNDTVHVRVGSTISASAAVTMVVKSAAGISNPGTASNYTLGLYTSKEVSEIASQVYAITASTVSGVTVAVSNQLTSQVAQYTVSFTTGSGGALTADVGTIEITFPSGTTLGGSIARSVTGTPNLTVQGVDAATVTVSGQAVTITTPTGIAASTAVTVIFASDATMLTNPTTANNNYQASVKTSAEATSVTSSTYAITTTTTLSELVVTPSANADGVTATYTIVFKLGSAGALTDVDSFKVAFPTGTAIASLLTTDVTVENNATGAANPAVAPSIDGLEVGIRVPSGKSYANSDSITIIVSNAKITNSTTTGTNKSLSVCSNEEPDPVSSATYTIISSSTSLTSATVVVNPDTISATAPVYTLTFNTGSKGGLAAGDALTVTFPSATTVPASMAEANVRVNGTAPTITPVTSAAGKTVTVQVPATIDTSTQIELAFLTGSGLQNPASATFYTLTVASEVETTAVTSSSYGISDVNQTGTLVVSAGESTPSNQTIRVTDDSLLVVQIKLVASSYENINLTSFKVTANGTGDDNADIDSVRVYLDANNNGALDGDTYLGSSDFSSDDGTATVTISTSINAGATLRWLVAYKMSSSGFSGKTYYPTIVNNTYLTATGATSSSPIAGDSLTVTAAPITGATLTLPAAEVTVAGTDISPGGAAPGSQDVGMLKLQFTADSAGATLNTIKVNNTRSGGGTFDAADIDSVKIYLDTGNGSFSTGDDTFLGGTTVTGASGGSGTVTLSSSQTIGITAATFFVAYDVSSSAGMTNNGAAQLVDNSYIGVSAPATVATTNFIIETTSETTLPVELTSFEATPLRDAIELLWTTQSETQNAGWRIIRLEVEDVSDTASLSKDARNDYRNSRLSRAADVAFLSGQGNKPTPTDYRYIDAAGDAGTTYAYYLVDIDFDGYEVVHGPVFATSGVPGSYRLGRNFPNPFNPSSTINFDLPAESRVRIAVYNTTGQRIRVLLDGIVPPGYHKVAWNGTDDTGRAVASGMYLYRIHAQGVASDHGFAQTRTMTLLK